MAQNLDFDRKRFDKILSYYRSQGLAPELSAIRIDEKLVNGQGVYNFNLKKENIGVSEKNLKRNDLFVCLGIGVFLGVKDTTKPGTEQLIAYAKQENTAAGIDGFTTKDINALYNGSLHIATGTTVNIDAMPCSLFQRVPVAQPAVINQITKIEDENAAVGTAKELTFTNALKSNGVEPDFDMNDAIQSMATELIFAGTQDHKVTVTFPTFASSSYATSKTNGETFISFVAIGYRVVGGTNEAYKVPANPYADAI